MIVVVATLFAGVAVDVLVKSVKQSRIIVISDSSRY